jgi:hypothetical protein
MCVFGHGWERRGPSNRACFKDDLRRMLCSTTSGSLLRLTTRCDIFLTTDPALESGDPAADGDKDRVRALWEGDVPSVLPDLIKPPSAVRRSSRVLPWRGAVGKTDALATSAI